MYFSKLTGSFYDKSYNQLSVPGDIVEITDESYRLLLNELAGGKILIADDSGYPIAGIPPAPPESDQIKQQIIEIEAQQTPRRVREALLGIDNGWLAGIEAQIEALRAQLAGA